MEAVFYLGKANVQLQFIRLLFFRAAHKHIYILVGPYLHIFGIKMYWSIYLIGP